MKLARIGISALIACFAAASASAALMRELSIDELSRTAELVVHGTVVSKNSLRDESGRIYTKIELTLAETWKGAAPGGTLTVVHGGGTVGDRRVDVSGQARYEVGEEVVLFLVRNPRQQAVSIGLSQGKFHVSHDQQTNEKFVHNPFHGVPDKKESDHGHDIRSITGKQKPAERLSLQSLKRNVEEALK